MNMNKVFGIGLSHTGTRSLNQALNILGIKAVHWPLDGHTYHELSNNIYRLSILKKYQGITDITTAPFYPQLDKTYPGSKFILTVRDKGTWLKSMKKVNKSWLEDSRKNNFLKTWRNFLEQIGHYGGIIRFIPSIDFFKFLANLKYRVRTIEFQRMATYGALAFKDEKTLLDIYDTHYKNVIDYFKERTDDLLIIDICGGDGWDLLSPFLSKAVPNTAFPHKRHKQAIRT